MLINKIRSVLLVHGEEAAALSLSRNIAVEAPHYTLTDLAKLDGRLEAHLDGLRIAADDGWRICEEELSWEEAGEVFTAAVLAFETSIPARIDGVLKVVIEKPELLDGLVSAIGWLPVEVAKSHIQSFLQSSNHLLQRAGVAGIAVHRISAGDAVAQFSRANDSALRARALKAIGELGQTNLISSAQQTLTEAEPSVRFAGAWSLAMLSGDKAALNTLQSFAEAPGPFRETAMQLLVRRLDLSAAKTWQSRLSREPASRRLSIQAAGAVGDPEAIPSLIEQMKVPMLARVAGEAFTTITGVGIAFRDLEGPKPEGFEAGPIEDPKDENVEMDPDDNLAWPNPALVENWWRKNSDQFQKGTRYLCGKPMTIEWLKQVLRDGYQRQRAAAALELAIRQPGTPLFNVKAPGFRQIQLLGKPGPVLR